MLHQTVEAVFPFRNLPPKPKAKPTAAASAAGAGTAGANGGGATSGDLTRKVPLWDSAAQAAQQQLLADAAAKSGNAGVDLTGGERPVSPLQHPMAVTPEDILFFSPGDRIIVLQQFRGSPWWLGAVKLCSQEQAHSKLRALERLNNAAAHSEIASSPILAKASVALRTRSKSINNGAVAVASAPTSGGSKGPLGDLGYASVLSDNEDGHPPAGGADGDDQSGSGRRLVRRGQKPEGSSSPGAAAASLVGGGGTLTNDSITAKLVRHASRRAVMQQLDAAQKEVNLHNSFAGMRRGSMFGEEVVEVESGSRGDMTSPTLSFDTLSAGAVSTGAVGKPPISGSGGGALRQRSGTLLQLDAPLEEKVSSPLDDGALGHEAGLAHVASNGSFSSPRHEGGFNGNASFGGGGGGLVSNGSFFINRDLGNAMDKALQEIPGNYNAPKPYDAAIDGELFNFRSEVSLLPTSPEQNPIASAQRRGSTVTSNGSFSSMPQFFRLGGSNAALASAPTSGGNSNNNTNHNDQSTNAALPAFGGVDNHASSPTVNPALAAMMTPRQKALYRLDAYKIGLFYVPFTRSLDELAKLGTTAAEDGRKAKDSLLKDVNQKEKGAVAKVHAGDTGVRRSSKAGPLAATTSANDANTSEKQFSVPMEMKTQALRNNNEKESGAASVKYHNVDGKVAATEDKSAASSAAADGGKPSMYYQSSAATSAGRGKTEKMSDEDDRRLRKLLGLDADDEDGAKADSPSAAAAKAAAEGEAAVDPKKDGFDFEGTDFRKALIEMQATSDNSHTQEQLDAARIRLLQTVIKGSSFDKATASAIHSSSAAHSHNTNASPSSVGVDPIKDQINQVHRQLLDKAVNLRTVARKLKRDTATLKIREETFAERIKNEAKLLRSGSMRKAKIVTSLLQDTLNDDDRDFDLAGSGMLLAGGSFAGKKTTAASEKNPQINSASSAAFRNSGQTPLEVLQCEVEIMKAKLKLSTYKRDQTAVRVEVLNAFADGVEEEAPHFPAFNVVEKENVYETELAAIIANGGKPPQQQTSNAAVSNASIAGREGSFSPNRNNNNSFDSGNNNGLNASFDETVREDRPPSPPTEAALIEEPKAKKLIKKIMKRIEEADATLEDYGKQKRKLERRIEKNGNILKEITKAIATHKENLLKRKKMIKDALGPVVYAEVEANVSGVNKEDDEVADDLEEAALRGELGPAPELPPPMGSSAAGGKKKKNGIAAQEEESDPFLAKCPSEVRHEVKMLLFDPSAIPEHQQSVEMIEKCMAAIEKLTAKAKKAAKSSTANAEATATLKAEKDKLQKKIAKGEAATSELERTIKFTQQEIDAIQKQALNAKANCEAAEKELAAKKMHTADAIKSWQAKKKEAGKDIEALKKKIETEKERVAKFEIELKQLEEKRAAAES